MCGSVSSGGGKGGRGSDPESPGPPTRGQRVTLVLLLLAHLAACFALLPPWEVFDPEPLTYVDHPVHTHRVYLYREALFESGLPWGCDPEVSGGSFDTPDSDLGAKPQQVLGVVLQMLPPWTIQRGFLFSSILLFPLPILMVCRWLGLGWDQRMWILGLLLSVGWLYPNFVGYFKWGMVAFADASYLSPLILVLFLAFERRPSLRTYATFFLGGALLFLIHGQGPWVIAPAILLVLLASRKLEPVRKLGVAVATPIGILLLNAFWFVPFVLASRTSNRVLESVPIDDRHPDMVYLSWTDLLARMTPFRTFALVVGLALALHGVVLLWRSRGRQVALAFAVAGFFGVFLKIFGSFLPVVSSYQPGRFVLPAFAILVIPAGLSLSDLARKVPVSQSLQAGILVALLISWAVWDERWEKMSISAPIGELVQFVTARTDPNDRLLVQTRLQSEPKVFPLAVGREVVGNTYPQVRESAQFLRTRLFGKPIQEWTAEELRISLRRWGISWVFAIGPEVSELLVEASDQPWEKVGAYRAFRFEGNSSRFEVGRGSVEVKVNRIELRRLEPEGGVVVLRYRYHPAWEASSGTEIRSYPVPEDPRGFIALIDPQSGETLRFDPMKMLEP